MGSKPNHNSAPTKAQSRTNKLNNKQLTVIKQSAKKKHQKWSKNWSERARDALDRESGLVYDALGTSSAVPASIPQTDSVVLLTEGMQDLGR